jgi:23S rRNA (uracil1939-C5)-methyltransferase
VGTFALALARDAGQVTGIEVTPASIEAARENAALNGITNAAFVTADARRFDQALSAAGRRPDVVVLDPPRAGAGAPVMRAVARSGAFRVVYISCNPTTLAPDLRELVTQGYAVRTIQPIDLFPQTYHIECVVALERAA